MITVLCVFNDQAILDKYLLSSLERQVNSYDLVLIDNTEKQYQSAAEALNRGAEKAKGDFLMFTHQDIELTSPTIIGDMGAVLDSIPNLGIAGVAGKIENNPEIISNIKDGTPPQKVSSFHINSPTRVQTVDECLFIIPRSQFKKQRFDEEVCNGWHLYAVDYSLSMAEEGYDVYVLPFSLYHKSRGYSLSREYFRTLRKLVNKHQDNYRSIHTTMWNWKTNYPMALQIVWQQLYWNLTLLKEKRI